MHYLFSLLVIGATFIAPRAALAVEFRIVPEVLEDQFKSGNFEWADIATFGLHLLQLMLTLAGSIAVIMLMWGGLRYIASGVTDDVEEAKNTIIYTLVGFAITALSWVAVDIVIAFLQGGE